MDYAPSYGEGGDAASIGGYGYGAEEEEEDAEIDANDIDDDGDGGDDDDEIDARDGEGGTTAADVISSCLDRLLSDAQEEANAAAALAARKREEADAAEADAEEKLRAIDELRERAREAAEDDKWTDSFERLRDWRDRNGGDCNPRRNWRCRVDPEEKALGNWVGKQRRDEREGKLNPLKKAALERIGHVFDAKSDRAWEDFAKRVKEYLEEHGGRLPPDAHSMAFKSEHPELYKKLLYYRRIPRGILGLLKDRPRPITQDRIDFLTEAGMDWMLTSEQVAELKEKHGLAFPPPADPTDEERAELERGDVPTLYNHHWIRMYEALVEFARDRGHTHVTPHNATPELWHWVCDQRERMLRREANPGDDGAPDHQAEMLAGLGFVWSKQDCDWVENYERICAYKRLFGVVALSPDKLCSFEKLEQWLEDNKRLHLGLPLLEAHDSASWAPSNDPKNALDNISIPLEERRRLLDRIGVFEVGVGDEEKALGKSHYAFRTFGQVVSSGQVILGRKSKRMSEFNSKGPHNGKEADGAEAQGSASARNVQRSKTYNPEYEIDSDTERDFFLKQGAIVSASVAEREELPHGKHGRRYYSDGRPIDLCRISNCFRANHMKGKSNHLCARHYNAIKGFAKNRNLEEQAKAGLVHLEDQAKANKGGDRRSGRDSNRTGRGSSARDHGSEFTCSTCHSGFTSFRDQLEHERQCGTVEEATLISIPQSVNMRPEWNPNLLPDYLQGEARALAEHYSYNVRRLTMHYHQKMREKPMKHGDKFVSAALGEDRDRLPVQENVCLQPIKFPTLEDELESTKAFRRCMGPLASTFSGREKLMKDGSLYYGDGRVIRFCRFARCQLVHSDDPEARYLCDFHHSIIQRPLALDVEEESSRRNKKRPFAEEHAYTKSRKATKEYNRYFGRPNTLQKTLHTASDKATIENGSDNGSDNITVILPPGARLGVQMVNDPDGGTVVSAVMHDSPLSQAIACGDKIMRINGIDVDQMDAAGISAILVYQQFANVERKVEFRRDAPAAHEQTEDGVESVTVNAPPGPLGLTIGSYPGLSGTFVVQSQPSSVLAKKVFPGYQIVSIDGRDVTKVNTAEVMSIMAQKAPFEKILKFTKGQSPSTSNSNVNTRRKGPGTGQPEGGAADTSSSKKEPKESSPEPAEEGVPESKAAAYSNDSSTECNSC